MVGYLFENGRIGSVLNGHLNCKALCRSNDDGNSLLQYNLCKIHKCHRSLVNRSQ